MAAQFLGILLSNLAIKMFSGAIHSIPGRLTNYSKPRLSTDPSRPGIGRSWSLALHYGSSGERPAAKGLKAQCPAC